VELLEALRRRGIEMNESAEELFASDMLKTAATRRSVPLPDRYLEAEFFADGRPRPAKWCMKPFKMWR
jgi:hypothetical protein